MARYFTGTRTRLRVTGEGGGQRYVLVVRNEELPAGADAAAVERLERLGFVSDTRWRSASAGPPRRPPNRGADAGDVQRAAAGGAPTPADAGAVHEQATVERSDEGEEGWTAERLRQLNPDQLAQAIRAERPRIDTLVAAVGNDGELARKVREAEQAASYGDPRQRLLVALARVPGGEAS